MEWDLSGCHTDENGKHWLDVQIDVDDYLRNEINCPYGKPGNLLRISEEVKVKAFCEDWFSVFFVADNLHLERPCDAGLTEKIKGYKTGHLRGVHLPPAFSRPTRLKITDIRVEQLQDITEAGAIAEGVDRIELSSSELNGMPVHPMTGGYRESFAKLWESINGPESWSANPWVWVVEFQKVEAAR